ncbi:MAG: DUF4215 domain-containing protein, partial [Deltaproteobacteria bacterium]|nr:DUF4215 domain-containing protein [Deltaproteobacteria bacterium]
PELARCRAPLACRQGVCQQEVGPGESCAAADFAYCTEGLTCLEGRCMRVLAAGGDCRDARVARCAAGLSCIGGACRAVLAAGGDCRDFRATTCADDLSCIDGLCRRLLESGGDCRDPRTTACAAGLDCLDGRCRLLLGLGGICEDPLAVQCEQGLVCGHDNGGRFRLSPHLDVCAVPGCGDGIVGAGEQCDDGDLDDADACRNDCTARITCPPPGTANGQVGFCTADCPCGVGGADCDQQAHCLAGLVCGQNNGARFGLPAPTDVCTTPGCGDGVVGANEACDDGNLDDGDGCRRDCTRPPVCPPPGTVQGQPGFCTADCPCGLGGADCGGAATCQAGLVCGQNNGARFGLAANHDVCTATGCGDGIVGAGEVCDDGNLDEGDGCRNDCTLPPNCPPPGTVNGHPDRCSASCPCPAGEGDCDGNGQCGANLVCGQDNGARSGLAADVDVCTAPGCGDGIVGLGEECDDGDLDDGDGCNSQCRTVLRCPPAGLQPGHPDYCTADCPCPAGGGDCDDATQCAAGLVCGQDNGARFGLPAAVDVCTAAGCGDGIVGPGEQCDDGDPDDSDDCLSSCRFRVVCPPAGKANGQAGFCTADCPCAVGQGPCNGDGLCRAGLVCGRDNGTRHGLPADLDVCAAPGCGDGLLGDDEPCDDGDLDDNDGCTSLCRLPCRDVAVFLANGQRLVIDRYEASRPDASAASEGVSAAKACSRPGVLPWTQADFAQAEAACQAAGGHLCMREEWQLACMGEDYARMYPYGSYWQAGLCNGYRGASNQLALTGQHDECVTPQNIYDLVGNLHEWVVTGTPDRYVLGGSYKLTALAVSQRLDSCAAQITVIPAADVGFRCCGP